MRIVIEIDPTGAESGARSPTASIRVECEVAPAPESARPANLAEARASAASADPMSTDAGAATSLSSVFAEEVPEESLARSAALNALDAGAAPDLVAGLPRHTTVTEADSPLAVLGLGGEPAYGLSSSSLEAVHDGGVTDAGPAPT